jgi:oligopeptide transport system substrate-binding protein
MFRRLLAGLAVAVAMTAAVDARSLRMNIEADPAMLDPITYSELVAGNVLRNVYEGFTSVDAQGNVQPALALRWEASPDNLRWRFFLRPNVKFHSGNTFTARDVKYTFEQLLLPGNRGGLGVGYLERVVGAAEMRAGTAQELSGVTVVDDLTVDIRMTSPDVLMPIYPFQFIDSATVRERGVAALAQMSAGTGPFSLVAWRRGQDVELRAHRDYWGGAPHIDGVQFLIVPSDDTAISMYQAGDLDIVWLQTDTARRVLRDAALHGQMLTGPAAQINYLGMNQNLYAPFRDKRVREAFCIAIDRAAMGTGLFGGLAEPLNGQTTPGVAGYNPNVPPVAYNPDRARQLLADAGFPGGRGMPPLTISAIPTNRTETVYLADQFRQVLGMTVEVNVQERGTFIRGMNAGEVPFFHWGWTADYPDALTFLGAVWQSSSPYNRARYHNPDYDRVMNEATVTSDGPARYRLYAQAETILLQDWGTCGTYVRTQAALVKPNVHGVIMTPFRLYPFAGVTND